MTDTGIDSTDDGSDRFRRERVRFYNELCRNYDKYSSSPRSFYQRRIADVYRFLIPPKSTVIELGCGRGELLAAVDPETGVGIDFSDEMIVHAETKFPKLRFERQDIGTLDLTEKFDFIILSDVINDLWDVQQCLNQLRSISHRRTRVIINFYSRLWELPLRSAQALKLANPTPSQNWLAVEDVRNLLSLANLELIRNWREILFPISIPGITPLANRFLVKLWPISHLALTNFMIARVATVAQTAEPSPTVSVIVPARNEEGNIEQILKRTPKLGEQTELIFVEGGSDDNTYKTIEAAISTETTLNTRLLKQSGHGKGDAVRLGFEEATGDVLMILDADMTVPPEDLQRFLAVLLTGKGDFINGVRLVYPMEDEAMRYLNLVGNKFFSLAFSWVLGQSIKDTLCGTKAMWKCDYEQIKAQRAYFGEFDPFGDFDLLFGAAKQNLKIIDLPIRYKNRTYGETNIQRWRHGWILLRMLLVAAVKIKFK